MVKVKELTQRQYDALCIIRDNPGIRARDFGLKLWPDSPAHTKVRNVGRNGATTGSLGWYAAGGYLGRLKKQGWIFDWPNEGYELLAKGRQKLKEYERKRCTQ